jgi:hypothetical protein
VFLQGGGNKPGKANPVDGQSASGRHSSGIGAAHNQGVQTAHFFFQEPDRIFQSRGAQGIAAHQFGKVPGMMRRCLPNRAHLTQVNIKPSFCHLPGRFGACQPGANNSDRFVYHCFTFFNF